jgi:hypothetical protein
MAGVLPSDESLKRHYEYMDVQVEIPDHDRDGAWISLNGVVTEVKVDGEDGCTLTVQVELPLESIPEL